MNSKKENTRPESLQSKLERYGILTSHIFKSYYECIDRDIYKERRIIYLVLVKDNSDVGQDKGRDGNREDIRGQVG